MARRSGRSSINLQEFVHQLITAAGGKVRRFGDRLQLNLPAALAEDLGLRQQHLLRFQISPSQTSAKEHEDFVAIGHPIIDRLLSYAGKRGGATKLLVPVAMDAAFLHHVAHAHPGHPSAIDEIVNKMSRVRFANATAAVWQKEVVYHTEVLFRFRVSLTAGDRKELLITMMIDPTREQVTRTISLTYAIELPEDRDDDPDMQYRLSRLYRKCEEHLGPRLKRIAEPFLREAQKRKALEQSRIEEYYKGLMAEQLDPLKKVFRQMAVAKVRADLARTTITEHKYKQDFDELKTHARQLEEIYEQKLAEFSREKDHRIQEVRDRYEPIAKVSLRQVALVLVPKIEWQFSLSGPTQRDVSISYDPIRRRVDGWRCDCCGYSLTKEAMLCACSSIACSDCLATCLGCNRTVCVDCSEDRCHLCNAPICAECPSTCPASSIFADLKSVKVCVGCQQKSCPTCIRVGFYHLEGVG